MDKQHTVTLSSVYHAAYELAVGPQKPSLLFALWGSILSPQKPLDYNCRQADALREYVRNGLPTTDAAELAALIVERAGEGSGWVYESHAKAIIEVDALYRAGALSALEIEPQSMREWVAWRKQVVKLKGLSWKTASFAALILWPFTCPFVPVDSHVCDRLGERPLYATGKLSRKSKPAYRLYRGLERRVYAEMRASGESHPITVWHWYQWELSRVVSGDATGEGVESHKLLNARNW